LFHAGGKVACGLLAKQAAMRLQLRIADYGKAWEAILAFEPGGGGRKIRLGTT
jgi:hypothetical protein